MTRIPLALALLIALASPAAAHKLKVFATVAGAEVTGYAFFVGGGRAQGTGWIARDAAGTTVAAGKTDAEGRYRFTPPAGAGDLTVTVNTEEGHIAQAVLPAARLDGTPAASGSAGPAAGASLAAAGVVTAAPAAAPRDDVALAALVEAAVQRQVEPLQEQIETMDARLRLTDVMSGIFLIIGLAGIGLFLRGRRG
ncbi:cobalamin biosynthesis protein CbiL [Sinirhodobacter ferrireducens]|uniref:Cobalamin biosynthesis protein CbiL n=1 Tax=Paenirhodobacter ferrireducens TaxID=1215032 RepID=A0A443LQA1_9RHOB|nr:cobalamin biosynthesis protein CbiL [Sinirhodobacter ferrireducens]RWR51343.1 cobalamin biosynthesis protein CbiL [Sinirhodobacter ferrireducens]